MRSPVRVFSTRPADRQYYEMDETNWFVNDLSADYIDPVSRVVPDVVSVDLREADLKYLLDLDRQHRCRMRNPQVRDAWEQYQMMLRLTGADQ